MQLARRSPSDDELLGVAEAAELFGLGKPALLERADRADFPRPAAPWASLVVSRHGLDGIATGWGILHALPAHSPGNRAQDASLRSSGRQVSAELTAGYRGRGAGLPVPRG